MAEEAAKIYMSAEAQFDDAIAKLKELTNSFQVAVNTVDVFENSMAGIKVANTQASASVNKTNATLHSLAAGATEDKAAFNSFNTTMERSIKATETLTGKIDALINKAAQSGSVLKNVSKSIDKTTNDMAAQANRFNTGNIAAQLQDIFVTAQMKMNPMSIALQQGTQLLYVFQQSKAPLKELIAGIKSLIGPLSLITVGLTGFLAKFIQTVDWVKVGKNALNGLANGFDYLAEHVTAFSAILLPVFAGFLGHILKSIKWLEMLKSTWTSIKTTLVNGAKLVFNAWVLIPALIVGFVEAVGLFPEQAKKVANVIIDIFTAMTNQLIGLFTSISQGLGIIIAGGVSGVLSGSLDEGIKTIKDTFADTMNKEYITVDRTNRIKAGAGKLIDSTSSLVKQVNNTIGTFLTGTGDKLRDVANGLGKSTKDAKKLQKDIDKINKSYENIFTKKANELEKLQFEDSLEGLTTYEKTYRTVVHDMTKDVDDLRKTAIEAGIPLAKINEIFAGSTTKIEDAARAEAEYRSEKERTREELELYNSVMESAQSETSTFFKDMRHGLRDGQSAWEAFGNAVNNVLDKILDKLIDIGVEAAFNGISTGGGGKDGWLGSLIKAGASYFTAPGSGNSTAGAFNAMGGQMGVKPAINAAGGVYSNGIYSSPTVFKFAKGDKFGVMGEAGPEAVIPLKRSHDGSLGVSADGVGGSPVVVNVINNSNAQARTERRQTDQGVEIDVLIDEMIGKKLNTDGTASNTALKAYNNRQLIMR